MWATRKIVKLFSAIVFNSCDWSKSFNTKNTLSKWSVNTFYWVNGLYVGLCILCVNIRTFLRGKAPLPHNKRSCYPPYPDHYLNLATIIKFKYEREKKRIMVVVVKWSHRPFFFPSLVTVPEAFAKVNSHQFLSRFKSGEFLVWNHVTWRPCWG